MRSVWIWNGPGFAGATDIQQFRFFTNAFDTMTQGIDVVATSNFSLGSFGLTTLSFAYNWNETKVGDVDIGEVQAADGTITEVELIDEQRINELENTLPNHRFVITGIQRIGPFSVLLRGSFFGEFSDPGTTPGETFDPTFLVDAEVGYSFFDDHFQIVAGAQNILNTFPQEYPEATQLDAGYRYPQNSPFGFNGGFYYFRLLAQL